MHNLDTFGMFSSLFQLMKADYDYFCMSYLVSGIKRCSPNKIEPDLVRLCLVLFE